MTHVAVCGAGIIGASTAYFLTRAGADVTLVERAAPAAAASGRSGGFLALDWCDGTPLAPLARASFALHAELAEELPPQVGYRRLETLSVRAARRAQAGGDAWLGDGAQVRGTLGSTASTAQIHPRGLTTALVDAAVRGGTRLVTGEVRDVQRGAHGRAAGIVVDDGVVAADAVVLALGPWMALASRWVRLPPVLGLRGHSLLLRPRTGVPPQALFVHDDVDDEAAPEIYPRPDGEVYVCGLADQAPLPVDPRAVGVDEQRIARLLDAVARVSPALAGAQLIGRNACFRPVTLDGLPLIGALREPDNVYVATGHSVWGMLNGPATGQALAALVLTGASPLALGAFDPNRTGAGPTDFAVETR